MRCAVHLRSYGPHSSRLLLICGWVRGGGRLAHGALVRRGCSTALTHHLAAVRNQLSALFQKRGSVVLEGGSVLHPPIPIDR